MCSICPFVNTYIGDVFRGATLDRFSDATVDEVFIDEVRGLDTVTEVLPLYVLDNTVQTEGQSLSMEATDDIALFNKMLTISYTEGDQEHIDSTMDSAIKRDNEHE